MAKKINNEYKEGNYEYYILQVIGDVCKKNRYPIKQKYAEAIAEFRNSNDPSLKNSNAKISAENVRPNMSRALDRLCKKDNPPIVCIRGKYYVPNNAEYLYEILSEKFLCYLVDKIVVDNKEVFLMSYNACALWAHKNPNFVDEENVEGAVEEYEQEGKQYTTAHKFIAECLEEYCFAVFGERNFIQVMVKCTNDIGGVPDERSKDFAVIRALEYAITRIYERQHITLEPTTIPKFKG